MALPIRLVWDLRIDRKRKTGLAVIFLLGFVDIIFAIVRVIETSASVHHVDVVWLGLWSMIEASVGESPRNSIKWHELKLLTCHLPYSGNCIMLTLISDIFQCASQVVTPWTIISEPRWKVCTFQLLESKRRLYKCHQ